MGSRRSCKLATNISYAFMIDLQAFHQDRARLERAFTQYFYRAPPDQHMDSNELIVAHGNMIAYFVLR
jgi:serine/threonine-protein phosphatase PGAM5